MQSIIGDTRNGMHHTATRAGTLRRSRSRTRVGSTRRIEILLWSAQGVLALIFLFAGSMKLVMPVEELTKDVDFPGSFMLFIGVAETMGALGLILPALLRIRSVLTPLAAAGLLIIMAGATVTTLMIGGGAGALVPFTVGLLLTFVIYGRLRLAPARGRSARLVLRAVA